MVVTETKVKPPRWYRTDYRGLGLKLKFIGLSRDELNPDAIIRSYMIMKCDALEGYDPIADGYKYLMSIPVGKKRILVIVSKPIVDELEFYKHISRED